MSALSDGTNNLDIVGGYAVPSGAYGVANKKILRFKFWVLLIFYRC